MGQLKCVKDGVKSLKDVVHEALELGKDRFGVGGVYFCEQLGLSVIEAVFVKIGVVNLIELMDGNRHFGETFEKEFIMGL